MSEEKAYMMSWDDQIAAEEGSNIVSEAKNTSKSV